LALLSLELYLYSRANAGETAQWPAKPDRRDCGLRIPVPVHMNPLRWRGPEAQLQLAAVGYRYLGEIDNCRSGGSQPWTDFPAFARDQL